MPTIETLAIPNFTINNIVAEQSLAADAAAGQAIAQLLNTADFLANDYAVISPADQAGELLQVNSVSNPNITFGGNFLLQHRNHERIVKLFGNQLRVYKAANVDGSIPADSTFLGNPILATIVIDPTQPNSYVTDNNGGNGYWYKFTYYNLTTGAETDISLSEAIRGGGYNHYVSVYEIIDEAGLGKGVRVDANTVAARRDESESEINGRLVSAGYVMPLQTGNGVIFNPAIVRNIDRILSAGYLLQKNFGTMRPGSSKDGKAKVDEARKLLAEIQLNDVVLLDNNGQMLQKPSLVDGWPDDTTAKTGSDGIHPEPPFFTMDKKF